MITAFCAAKDMFISTELQVHWWGSEVCECYCDILALCYGVLGHLLKSISSYQLNNWQLDRYAASFLYILLSMSYETLSKPALIMIIKHVYLCMMHNFQLYRYMIYFFVVCVTISQKILLLRKVEIG